MMSSRELHVFTVLFIFFAFDLLRKVAENNRKQAEIHKKIKQNKKLSERRGATWVRERETRELAKETADAPRLRPFPVEARAHISKRSAARQGSSSSCCCCLTRRKATTKAENQSQSHKTGDTSTQKKKKTQYKTRSKCRSYLPKTHTFAAKG